MTKYILTSSLNYNSIMSTHVLGCENYYKERLYGTDRFYKIATDDIKDGIRVFEDLKEDPEYFDSLLLNSDCEEYLVAIKIKSSIPLFSLNGNLYCSGPIYLDSIECDIEAMKPKHTKIIKAKSKIVAEVKEPIISLGSDTEVVIDDNVRNTLKGSCLISELVRKKYNIEISMCCFGLMHDKIDADDILTLRKYNSVIKEIKRKFKNTLANDNIREIAQELCVGESTKDIRLISQKLLMRDYTVKLEDVTNLVNRGLLLFLMKATKVDELIAFKTDDITKSVALLFYGTYTGFSKLDRLIYEEVGAYDFAKSWLNWLKYFDRDKTPNSSYLRDEDVFSVSIDTKPTDVIKAMKNMKLFNN